MMWYQVLLFNTNCTQLYGLKRLIIINGSVWLVDRTLTDTTTLGQSGPEGNGNEWMAHSSQILKTGTSLSDAV